MYYLCNSTSVQIGPLENFFHQLHLFFYFQGRLKPQVIVHSTLKFFSKKKMIFKENYSSNVMNMNIKYETNNYTLMLFSPGDQFSQCQICFFHSSFAEQQECFYDSHPHGDSLGVSFALQGQIPCFYEESNVLLFKEIHKMQLMYLMWTPLREFVSG